MNKPFTNLRRTIALSIVMTIMSVHNSFSQNPVFSQFYLAPLQLNPAFAGLNEDIRVAASYRNQYPGFNQAYTTYTLSGDLYFPHKNIGGGLWVLTDNAGDGILKTTKFAGAISYRIRTSDNGYMKLGVEAGLIQTSLHWDKLVFGDQLNDLTGSLSPGGTPYPTEENAPSRNNLLNPDFGIGMMVYGKSLFGGVSVRHLNRPDLNFLEANPGLSPRMPMHWQAHVGATITLLRGGFRGKERVTLNPALLLSKQGPLTQINGGATLDFEILNFGLYYRHTGQNAEAIIGSIGLKSNQFTLAYSFDYVISGFPISGGTHEIGLVFVFGDGESESRYNDCLHLFR